MALVTSRTDLSQGSSLAVPDAIFATAAASGDIRIHTGTNNNLPALAVGEMFEVRDHSLTQNNGLYEVDSVATSTDDYDVNKISGSAPSNSGAEAVTTLGATGSEKNVFFDTAGLGIYVIEQDTVDANGVVGQALYSFCMQEWKDDDFLIANAPFPMICIDADAGKYIVGQDASGNYSGWTFVDGVWDNTIRTRKLLRNMGWDEVDSSGNILARYVGVVTLGTFEDDTTDTAYYMFGTDTTVDNTVDFDFAGPVNESVKFYEEVTQPATFTYVDGAGGDDSVTRASGSFITDGFVVGGQMTTRNSNTPANDGTYTITGMPDALTLEFATGSFDTGEADASAEVSVNNGNAMVLKLRVRDGDTNGKTFGQANLASAGKTALGNFVYSFPLSNATDLKITATDVGIDSNSDGSANVSPYDGMSITYYATPQSKTDLSGGAANFGIIVDGNGGTAEEVFEFVQWSLRSTGGFGTGDIDADADTAIGRAMDGLAGFVGDTGHFGTPDNGLTFPTNPDGGGSGVYVSNLAAASKNSVVFYDNTNAQKTFPETIAITLDFNATLEGDATTEYDLFYDRTIRTSPTGVTLTTGTNVLAGTGLPNNSELAVGSYVRVAGLVDATMDGVYQIVTETTPGSSWVVTRYDGVTIETVGSSTPTIDQNCVDTPDAIIVHTNVKNSETASTIDFTAPDLIDDTASGFGSFVAGMFIQVEGSTAQDGIYEIATATAGQLELVEQTITTEGASSVVVTEIVSGLAGGVDEQFSYSYSSNVQGGKTGDQDAYVRAKAIGSTSAQYVTSTVQTIESGTPLTIPLVAQAERNYA